MSDEHTADPDVADNESGDSLEPGGGPQRVVSEESVDDILASLDETKSGSTDANETTVTADEPDDAVTTTFDEDDVPAADESTDDDSQPDTGAAPEAAPVDPATDSEPTTDTSDSNERAVKSEPDTTADDTATVDAAASSLPDDASLEELAARVEEGTVTGADVRAAEAGDGRESTPEIDEVDLSLDDLEMSGTGAGDTGGDPNMPDDAGPLAGTVDRDDATDTSDDDDSDDTPGLLGRIKNFFSR